MPQLIPVRYFEQDDLYNYVVDNRPLSDLKTNLDLVNAAADSLVVEFADAKGSAPDLATKLQYLGDDGALSADGLPVHSIEDHTDSATYVRMELAEREKLALVSDRANRFSLHVNQPSPDPLSGDVVIQGGRSILITTVPTVSEKRLVRIDTAFPPDKIHEHRYSVKITRIDKDVAYVPNGETYVPGTLVVTLNGTHLGPSSVSESASLDRFTLFLDRQVDLARDEVLANYEVVPAWDLLTSDPLLSSGGRPQSIKWIRSSRLGQSGLQKRSTSYTLSTGGSYTDDVWMIDVSDYDFVEPFDRFNLFVNGSLVYYGCDWDFKALDGRIWLRWRYSGSGSVYLNDWLLEDFDDVATYDLAIGDELSLDAYVSWP